LGRRRRSEWKDAGIAGFVLYINPDNLILPASSISA